LNWYRGQDILWQEAPFLIGRKLLQPTLYIAGEDDPVVEFARPRRRQPGKERAESLEKGPAPGVGHRSEQEAPAK
jgi:pimeloyl-ACP methyl ester carboxylesterase